MEIAERKTIATSISARFATKFDQEWVKWKLTADPLFISLLPWLREPELPVLDVGCGRGLLGFYMRESGLSADYVGIDFDTAKITPAQAVASQYTPSPQYHQMDARQPWPDIQGHVCLLDVLHYLPVTEQRDVLRQCAAHVAAEGHFIIRSGIRDAGWRYRFTAGTDKVMAACGLMKSPPLHYPTLEEIGSALDDAGLKVAETHGPEKRALFNNHLLICQRKRS